MHRIGSPARLFTITRHFLLTASMTVLLAALPGAGSVAAQTLPVPTDIGHLGGGSAQATAAADGYVVGHSTTSSGDRHAFVWSVSTQTMVDIGALISGSPLNGATGVNSRGEVVGGSYPSDYSSTTGFYWSQATGLISLGPIFQNYNQTPLVISESGVVAGASVDGQIFRWTPTGGFTYLGFPPAGYFPVITGINSRGDIVGNSGAQAFFVAGNSTTMTVLTSPDSRPGEIVIKAINDSGIAVGYYAMAPYDSTGSGDWVSARYAFKWDTSTPPNAANIVNLGNLGRTWSEANGINNNGVIVGYSTLVSTAFVYDAFTYQGSGPMVALQRVPGSDWNSASAITDDGVVVGFSTSQGTIWENGVPRTFSPSFAPYYNTLLLKGNTLAGTGLDANWNSHAWTLALPRPTVFASGKTKVTTWDPITPNAAYANWTTSICSAAPLVGPDANWVNPHDAFVFPLGSHPWEDDKPYDFDANWINAWANLNSVGPSGHNWTKYSTQVTGEGDFVVQFLADNCSWIYLDDRLIGVQDTGWNVNGTGRYPVTLAGPGPHTLSFIIFDGGGSAGGKFRLETRQSFIDNGGDVNNLPSAKQASTTTVSFGVGPFVYTGQPFQATASVSPSGQATITYSGDCTNAGGSCTATATYAGDANYESSSATASITITKAPTTTTVTFGAGPFVYNGSAFAATASTDNGGTPTIAYTGDCTNAGSSCAATATYAGDANYTGSGATVSITIAPASATIVATPYDVEYDGQPHTATFAITGVNGETGAVVGTVTHNTTHISVGVYSDTWSFSGANYITIAATPVTNRIKDTTAPVITSVSTNAPALWPPNHRMVAVTVGAAASDLVGVTSLKIVSVTSSEPDNGLGDGDTAGDIQVTGDLTLNLRAERAGKGNGRTYTITVEARDAAGNASTKTCTVFVPKSQGK